MVEGEGAAVEKMTSQVEGPSTSAAKPGKGSGRSHRPSKPHHTKRKMESVGSKRCWGSEQRTLSHRWGKEGVEIIL